MKKSIRLALLAGACFLGLAVAAPAIWPITGRR